jgi:hypothetical protein
MANVWWEPNHKGSDLLPTLRRERRAFALGGLLMLLTLPAIVVLSWKLGEALAEMAQ